MKIAIWGCGNPVLDIIPILQSANIEIAYVKVDNVGDEDFFSSLKKLNIVYYTDAYPPMRLDMIFVINYNRIISSDVIADNLVVNCHMGLLPKWRGNSANGWGIINGENYVEYTIHRVTEVLDAGPSYYQYKYPYKENETYYHAKKAMSEDLNSILPLLLYNIVHDPERYLHLKKSEFVYCSKFRPADGFIYDWNVTTEELIRCFYVFAPPLGTGLKFVFKGTVYEISRLSAIEGFAKSKGIPGGVVYKNGNSVWIKTQDTAVSLDEIKCDGEILSISSLFIVGQRL